MRAEDLDHEELRELDLEGGVIRFAGRRALLLDTVAMGLLAGGHAHPRTRGSVPHRARHCAAIGHRCQATPPSASRTTIASVPACGSSGSIRRCAIARSKSCIVPHDVSQLML